MPNTAVRRKGANVSLPGMGRNFTLICQGHLAVTISALASAFVLALSISACAQKEEAPETTTPRKSATPAQRPDIDFEAILGVARARPSGVICLAMPAVLRPGDGLTLVTVPIALARVDSTPADYSSVVAARVMGTGGRDCTIQATGGQFRLPGDSIYTLSLVRDTEFTDAVYFAVDMTMSAFFRVGHIAGARISGSTDVLNFRICASAEGLHLTVWEGKPVTGKRVWHRYFYLGYDMQPTCVEADYS